MRRTEALQGVRMAVFLNVLNRWESAELNQEEAAELLGVSERTFRRWTRRYEEEGEAGLLDRRLGKASGKRVPADRAEEVERLYRERYPGFSAFTEDDRHPMVVDHQPSSLCFVEHPLQRDLGQPALGFGIAASDVSVRSRKPKLLQVARDHYRRRKPLAAKGLV